MDTITIHLHHDLSDWLMQTAAKRGLAIETTISRLLDEARMRECCLERVEVPAADGRRWTARTPLRGLIYSGYDIEWSPADVPGAEKRD